MIVTELYSGQGLGNQLWCYAVCRSIADHLNMPFKILGKEHFKGEDFLQIDFGSDDPCENDVEYRIFHEQRFFDKGLKYVASTFDDRVKTLSPYTKLEGLFQSEKYFFDNIDIIKNYIKIKDEYKALVNVEEDVCILNIRGGEYKRHKRFILPRSYWLNAMENMKKEYHIEKFLIVTDDQEYAAALLPGIDIVKRGVAESYVALHNASYFIVSNSTFSYFPIKTKETKATVIAPKYFARFNDRLNRWASPANIYKDWIWQDRDGKLFNYADCKQEAEALETEYKENYYISVPPELIYRRKINSLIPSNAKKSVKRVLAKLFPLKYG